MAAKTNNSKLLHEKLLNRSIYRLKFNLEVWNIRRKVALLFRKQRCDRTSEFVGAEDRRC